MSKGVTVFRGGGVEVVTHASSFKGPMQFCQDNFWSSIACRAFEIVNRYGFLHNGNCRAAATHDVLLTSFFSIFDTRAGSGFSVSVPPHPLGFKYSVDEM